MIITDCTEKLFSYGTLRQAGVQQEVFGRLLVGEEALLSGFALENVRITDPTVLAASGKAVHPILRYTGNPEDQVDGFVFHITPEELVKADKYEVGDYQRSRFKTVDGDEVWVYVGES